MASSAGTYDNQSTLIPSLLVDAEMGAPALTEGDYKICNCKGVEIDEHVPVKEVSLQQLHLLLWAFVACSLIGLANSAVL